MSTLRDDYNLTKRNDTFNARVKRTNNANESTWSYNPVLERSFIISTEPDPPIYPPFKNALTTT